MKYFRQKNEKQNIFQGSDLGTNEKNYAGFVGGSKLILLACSALIFIGLLSAVPLISSEVGTDTTSQYPNIAMLANEKLKSEDFGEAIELFEQAIKINPTDEELYIGLADSYKGVNETYKAREVLEAGYNETKSNNIKTKLNEFDKINSSDKFNELLNAGKEAFYNKDYQSALMNFLDALKINSQSVEVYLLAADSCADAEKAVEILEKGFELTGSDEIKERIKQLKNQNAESSQSSGGDEGETSKNVESASAPQEDWVVEIKTHSEQNSHKFKDIVIFESSASWFELSENDNYPGLSLINSAINEILNRYFKFEPSIYGAETDEDIYNYVDKSGKKVETNISITSTYNSNDIVSYTVDLNVSAPDVLTSLELHTINIKTGEELKLNNILSGDENNIEKTVINAYSESGINIAKNECENIRFYLERDRLVLISSSGKAYIPFVDTDKFVIPLSASDTSKVEN